MKFFGRKEESFVYEGCRALWSWREENYMVFAPDRVLGTVSTKNEAKNLIDEYWREQ